MPGHIDGIPGLVASFKKQSKGMKKGMEIGLKRAGLYIQRKSQEIVPIDTGILRNSARTDAKGSGFKTEVSVMYLASYAIYVHEDKDAKHSKGRTYRYLQKAIEKNRKRIFEIVGEAIQAQTGG